MKKYLVYLMMVLSAFTFNACGNDDPIMEDPGTEQPETPGDSTDNPDDPANPMNRRETAIFLLPTLLVPIIQVQ